MAVSLAQRPAVHGGRYFLDVQGIKGWGYDLEALGITCHKNRPYVVISSNRKMAWLVPMSSQLKGKNGRVEVRQTTPGGNVTVGELVTTDMFMLPTFLLERFGQLSGKAMDMDKIVKQFEFSIETGRLGINR